MGLFSLLLVLLSILSQAKEKDRLPELQKAVGKDWVVTALPDGYLVTYVPLVSFYPAISESSKLDYHQRAAHGRMDHLRIKIFFGHCLTDEELKEYGPFKPAHRRMDSSAPPIIFCAICATKTLMRDLSSESGNARYLVYDELLAV